MVQETLAPTSFSEYQFAYPEQARAVVSFSSYRTLANLDHDRFWDPEVYEKLKGELQTGDPFSHLGVRLYEKQLAKESPHYRAASDAQLSGALMDRIRTNTKALELWEKAEPEEFGKARELIEAIRNGQLEQFDRQKLKEVLHRSLYIFPGVALSFLIRKGQLDLQETGRR